MSSAQNNPPVQSGISRGIIFCSPSMILTYICQLSQDLAYASLVGACEQVTIDFLVSQTPLDLLVPSPGPFILARISLISTNLIPLKISGFVTMSIPGVNDISEFNIQ